jgi:hypothetical protein
MSDFTTAEQVKAHVAALDPEVCRIRPHHSASYLYEVWHPASFGRLLYGISSEASLVAWANEARIMGAL